MTEPLDRIPYYRRPRRQPRRRLSLRRGPTGKPRGSFFHDLFVGGVGVPTASRRRRPVSVGQQLADDDLRAHGVPVFDEQAGMSELGGYTRGR
jgi:hypothetical protein